jgi:hypothetical protein
MAAGLVVVVGLVVLFWTTGGSGGGRSATPAGAAGTGSATGERSGAAATSSAPAPSVTAATADVDEPPPALPAVPLDATAAVGNGIVATLPQIEAFQGSGTGRGDVAGPALRVTVRIENGTGAAVSLDGVAVSMFHGPGNVPASPLGDASQRPFAGTVAPGATAEGSYVFQVPLDVRDSVTVEVGYQAGAPLLLFTGPAD